MVAVQTLLVTKIIYVYKYKYKKNTLYYGAIMFFPGKYPVLWCNLHRSKQRATIDPTLQEANYERVKLLI